MESFISSHIDKLNQIAPNDDSQIDLHVKAKFGAKENLIVTQNDLRLSCCMYWKMGSFDISIIKRDFLKLFERNPSNLSSRDFIDLGLYIELYETKNGELTINDLNGIEDYDEIAKVLSNSNQYGSNISDDDVYGICSEIYSDGDIDESEFEFMVDELIIKTKKQDEYLIFSDSMYVEYEGTAVAFILFIHSVFTKAQSLDDTKSIIADSIQEVVKNDEIGSKCWEEGYKIFRNNSTKLDNGEGWEDYYNLIEKLHPNLRARTKEIISEAIFKINKNNEENSTDYGKAKVCNLMSNIDFSRDSWGDIVNDSSHKIKLKIFFQKNETPEYIVDGLMMSSLKNNFETEIYSKNGGFNSDDLDFFVRININSKLNPIYKWLKDCFVDSDSFYFEEDNEAGPRVLLNYGIIKYEIINKEKKSIISEEGVKLSYSLFDDYDLEWFDV